MIQKIVFMRN